MSRKDGERVAEYLKLTFGEYTISGQDQGLP